MIKKQFPVEMITLGVSEGFMIKGVAEELDILENIQATPPIVFKINGSWRASHQCSNCRNETGFGCIWDGRFNNCHHHEARPLTSKYYSLSFLGQVGHVLTDVHVVASADTGWHALTVRSFTDTEAPFLFFPVINLLFYQCANCKADYLCRYRFIPGSWPDTDCPEGRLNRIAVDEIISIKVHGYADFADLIEDQSVKIK